MNLHEQAIIEQLALQGIQLGNNVYEKLFSYIQELLLANQTTNLTAIKDYGEALIKHLYDSLVIMNLPIYQAAKQILDVGSGGGLPGIPLAICSPEKTIISLEATAKKVSFQTSVCEKLMIYNHHAVWQRAEEAGHDLKHRAFYGLVVARALAAADVLAELTLPFVAENGYAVFYKAKGYQTELETAETAIEILGGRIETINTYDLPGDSGERNMVVIKKIKPTPTKYPRRTGIPQKTPLK